MRHTQVLLLMTLLLSLAAGCQSGATDNADPATPPALASPMMSGSSTATLIVHGMGCPLCANNLDKQLLALPGVEKVHVNLGSGSVLVTMAAANRPTDDQLTSAVQQSGYTLVRIDVP